MHCSGGTFIYYRNSTLNCLVATPRVRDGSDRDITEPLALCCGLLGQKPLAVTMGAGRGDCSAGQYTYIDHISTMVRRLLLLLQ